MEKLSDHVIASDLVEILKKFTGNQNIPMPVKYHCSRWNSNEFFRGSYSFTSKACDEIENWEDIINEPIIYGQSTKNVLLFAGEGCSKQYFSTLHGAFSSGINQSTKLLQIINRGISNSNEIKIGQSKL